MRINNIDQLEQAFGTVKANGINLIVIIDQHSKPITQVPPIEFKLDNDEVLIIPIPREYIGFINEMISLGQYD